MSFTGKCFLSKSNQAGKAYLFKNGLRPENGGPSNIEFVGTIESLGQTRYSMSWSSDGRHLATSTGENVSVWRLPGKDLQQAIKNIDAEQAKVGRYYRYVEAIGPLKRL